MLQLLMQAHEGQLKAEKEDAEEAEDRTQMTSNTHTHRHPIHLDIPKLDCSLFDTECLRLYPPARDTQLPAGTKARPCQSPSWRREQAQHQALHLHAVRRGPSFLYR
ncbi:Protein of unknown function [Gryllus bimaculatus]|nr:Protein of unknown function [Gryllus bimaculatus]